MRTYELNEHQKIILKEVNQLPLTDLYYIVVQQSDTSANLTLKELKKYIKRSIKEYVKRSDLLTYWEGKENEVIKYYCFFETTKEFYLSQHTNLLVNEDFYCGFHFHLFISGVNEYYIKELIFQLSSLKHKPNCISKIDGIKIERLNNDFILYHTKQLQHRYSSELILKNN
jgi:hypothetical protein